MSIKKLFESTNKVQEFVSQATGKDLFVEDAESFRNVEQKKIDQDRYVPQVDYSLPENFVRFGSARLYYKSALNRIKDYYPYDGSEAEKNEFLNGCLDIERYILDNKYPRTTGYVELGYGGYSVSTLTDGYGVPTTDEYIDFFGGPGTGRATSSKLKDLMPNPNDSKYNYSNIYDESIYVTADLPTDYGKGTRTSNLKSDFDDGVTVEFWMKTGSLNPATITNKQVIFDMWNQMTDSTNARMMIELTSSHGAASLGKPEQRPFLVTVQSGSHTTKDFLSLGDFSLHENMGEWNHYAIRLHNTGSSFRAQLYVNGYLNDSAIRMPYGIEPDSLTDPRPTSAARAWPHAIEKTYSSADNLQGWWRLETNGNPGKDSSTRGRTGAFGDPPAYNASQTPSSYIVAASHTFDGVSDRVNIGADTLWNGIIGTGTGSPRKMTFSAWIRPHTLGEGNTGRILDFGTDDIAFRLHQGSSTSNWDLKFSANWNSGTKTTWGAEIRANLNEWAHVAVTYDANDPGNNPKLYYNGVEQSVTETGTAPAVSWDGISGGNCFIGSQTGGTKSFDGEIADVAIWNSILTTNEIAAIYSAYTIKSTTHTVGELGPRELKGRIGALQTTAPGPSSGPAKAGRLSGSLDEFRFWKTKRTSKEIGRNWFTQVRGGTNSDISNTTLGVYYKFNEGITGDSATDSVVLDYAGRVTNGAWTGYTANSRNTGSAIVSASAATKEFLDPIIRTNHPSYISLESELLNSGSSYDYQNNSSILNLVPSWITLQDDENDNNDLKYITHVMGAYFDKLYLQISDLPKLRHQTHTSGTFKAIPFAEHLPQSLGLYSPEIFIDSTVLEKFMNRSEKTVFDDEISEAKNLIYQNLYNNLAEIYKAKGTEQAIKNVLKCFNIDDKLLKLKINSNNNEIILNNNLEQNLVIKNCADFSISENNGAVIYQKLKNLPNDLAVVPGIDPLVVAGSLTGSTSQYGYGFTYEANVFFPDYEPLLTTSSKLKENFKQMSLFGTVTTDGTIESSSYGTDLTKAGAEVDFGNFKVYFVRDEMESKAGHFKLVAANPDDPAGLTSTFTLTSSVFNNIYNNEMWNLSIRVKPEDYPLGTFVHPFTSSHMKYDVEFSGYNAKSIDLFDSFKVSTKVNNNTGKKYIESGKRAYVGADRTSVTGKLNYYSDVLVSSIAYWTKYLQDTDLQQHILDIENIGLSGSVQFMNGLDGGVPRIYNEALNHNSLALNWNFRNITGSDASGKFVVQDFSSGSATGTGSFGWVGAIAGNYYTGQGDLFKASSKTPVAKKRLNSFRFVEPERPVSSDMIQIFTSEDDLTPNLRREEILPNFVYSLEKSLYDAISQEMLDFFAGAIDFNDVIGHPVHQYRDRYKEIEKLREIFFRRVTETSTVENYTQYYKWFDDAITTIISQLVPASSEYINDIQNVIESHVLERNKYQNRLNIFDADKFSIERVIPDGEPVMGLGPLTMDWLEYTSTIPKSPRDTISHREFWRQRADRTSPEISSGNSIVDNQRNTFRDIIYSQPIPSGAASAVTVATDARTTYQSTTFLKRTKSNRYAINASIVDETKGSKLNREKIYTRDIRGGVNFENAKNLDFAASNTRPAGPVNREGGKFVPLNVMIGFVQDATEIPYFVKESDPVNKITKKKKIFKVQSGRDWEDGIGYKNVKSTIAFPFNVFSSSVEVNSGYNAEVISRVGKQLIITNLHNDVYGDNLEKPMQGPFTDYLVGGHQSRHIDVNTGTDQQNNRPEAWRILLGTCDEIPSGAIGVVGADYPPANYEAPVGSTPYPYLQHQKAYLYRDFIAKRPVNIKNVNSIKNNKTVPGNFTEQYQVIHSFGAFNNPRAFIDNKPTLPPQLSNVKFTTNVRTFLDIKRNKDGRVSFVDEYSTQYLDNTANKTIIVSRFGAPGGIEGTSKGYSDFKSSEMSPYNSLGYRNMTVLRPQQGPSGTVSKPAVSGDTTNIQVSDIHNKDYGLRSHLARHSAKFGRDSIFVTNPGTSYVELPSFHKINRNPRQVMKAADVNHTVFVTSSKFDNAFVVRPIPQSDRQYMWLSNSVQNISDIKYAGYQNVGRGTELDAFRSSSLGYEYYWTFVSASNAETGSLFQPTNPLNIIIEDPISASTHTIGFDSSVDISNYTNKTLVGNTPNPNYLNQLLTSRGATYGWGWNKFHNQHNRVIMNDRKNNQLVIATSSLKTLSTHELRPLSLKGRVSYINYDVLTPGGPGTPTVITDNVTLKFTNTNEKIFFNDLQLNNYIEVNYNNVNEPYRDALRVAEHPRVTLNWFLYQQNIFPSLRNEFSTFNNTRFGYDNKFWRDSRAARGTLGSTLSSSTVGAMVSKSAWVLDAPENFLTRTSIFGTSGSAYIPFNSMLYLTASELVRLTGSAAYNTNVPAGGELQNTYFSYFNISLDGGKYFPMQLAPLYARKHVLGSPNSVVSPSGVRIAETGSFTGSFDLSEQITPFAGEALWEANTQAGIVSKTSSSVDKRVLLKGSEAIFIPSASNPWYDDYDDFKSDLKLMAKGYSVVPEYRMSEHIRDYVNFGINNESKTDFFEIVGTTSSSSDRTFYKDYSNTDFLENFLGIKRASLLNAKEIQLSCHAAIKYNPYKGFYPAERTTDLVEQFADSFKDSVGGALSGSAIGLLPFNNKIYGHDATLYQRAAGVLKPLFDPLVSPGILYNSIKSGIAIDYPIVSNHNKKLRRAYGTNASASTTNYALSITGSATLDDMLSGSGQYLGGQFWDKRIPFEAIIEPRKYILNTNFTDLESHPSMSLDWNWAQHRYGPDKVYGNEAFTGSFSDNADGIYTLMARNFFGAAGEFFLQGSGITRLESDTVLNDIQFTKDSNFAGSRPLYMARIKLRRSHNGARTYEKEYDSYGNVGGPSYYGVNGAQRTINGTQSAGQYPIPQDPMRNSLFKETFTMYSRPTAFGPPCAGRPTGSNAAVAPFNKATRDSFSGFNPAFTPPYYDGEAWADLIFRPHVVDKSSEKTSATETYDLNRILNETQVVCWRFDAGENRQVGDSTKTSSMPVLIPVEQTQLASFIGTTPSNDHTVPSIYDGKRINANSMQLTSSVNIFGTEKVLEQNVDKFGKLVNTKNVPVGAKWIIQPKWETPMLNFNDEGVHPITAQNNTLTLPIYGSASVPRGMWHQFGVIPEDPNKGIFLEITDIPEDWLKNHYEVLASDRETPYNGNAFGTTEKDTKRTNLYKHVRSLSSLCGFDRTNSSTRLGAIKESLAVHEAIVAVPYVINEVDKSLLDSLPVDSEFRKTRKSFISIPKRRFSATRLKEEGTAQGDALSTAGESIRKLKQAMEKFVFPPEFDFLHNKEVDPIAMYVFEFKYEFDRDDLSYIWQNLAPRNSKKVTFQKSSVSHNLANNELINAEVLNNENLRWMVFKVKQRCQTDYFDLIADKANESTSKVKEITNELEKMNITFNWPYDYLSFVELIKMDVNILLKNE